MNKKTLFAFIVLIGCVVLLVGSYMQWNQKISSTENNSPSVLPLSEDQEEEEIVENTKESKKENDHLLALTKNADERIQQLVQARMETDKSLNFLITGSTVMENGNPGYAEQLKEALEKAYGDFIKVTVQSFDTTSQVFTDNLNDELDLSQKFDIVLFEPFILKNNGVISPENQAEYIERFHKQLTEEVEDVMLVLHPPQPLPNAIYYPLEVEFVLDYAKSNDIPYINHWTYWPPMDSEDFPNHLDEDSAPSNAGAKVWANALIEYFIAE